MKLFNLSTFTTIILPLSLLASAGTLSDRSTTSHGMDAVEEATAVTLVNQVVNLFVILADTNGFDRLDEVFMPDATAVLHPPGDAVFHGVDEITKGISGLAAVTGQHGITTQYVNVTGKSSASAIHYLANNFYGKGATAGQTYTLNGRYESRLVRAPQGWRIQHIELIKIQTSGNASVVFPP